MKIPMSYGEIDTEKEVPRIWEMARNINPNNIWEKRAVDWPALTENSVVVEVGGYQGLWSFRMAERYDPKLYIYEPQTWCCEMMKEVLAGYNVRIYPYALGDAQGEYPVYVHETDGCTLEKPKGKVYNTGIVRVEEMDKAFAEAGIGEIDVMNMNVESWEFVLIPYMLKCGIYPKVFMFQGHDKARDEDAKQMLRKHYVSLWDYGCVLSTWVLHS